MTQRTQQPQDQPDHQHEQADRPDNWNARHEPNDEKNHSENNHHASTAATWPPVEPLSRWPPRALDAEGIDQVRFFP